MRSHPAAPLRLQRSLGAATVMAVHRGGQHVLGVREVGMRQVIGVVQGGRRGGRTGTGRRGHVRVLGAAAEDVQIVEYLPQICGGDLAVLFRRLPRRRLMMDLMVLHLMLMLLLVMELLLLLLLLVLLLMLLLLLLLLLHLMAGGQWMLLPCHGHSVQALGVPQFGQSVVLAVPAGGTRLELVGLLWRQLH